MYVEGTTIEVKRFYTTDGDDSIVGSTLVVANPTSGELNLSDLTEFSPQSPIFVETNIEISGSGGFQLNTFEKRFSQASISQGIPEPSTTPLVLGLFVVGAGLTRFK